MPKQLDWFYVQEDFHTIFSLKTMELYTNSWICGIVQNMQVLVGGMAYLIGTPLV